MGKLIKFFIVIAILLTVVPASAVVVSAATVSSEQIESDSSYPNDSYIFNSPTTYVYKNSVGTCSDSLPLKDLVDDIKETYYKEMLGLGNKKFKNTDVFKGIKYVNKSNDSKLSDSPLKKQSITSSYSYGSSGIEIYFKVKLDGSTIKFYIPKGSYQKAYVNPDKTINPTREVTYTYHNKVESSNTVTKNQGYVVANSDAGIKAIITGVKEGIIAANIELGFNVGSVYSENQKSLNDVMTQTSVSSTTQTDENGTKTVSTGLFKFKDSSSMKASLDYFICPLFGKISVEDIPKDDAAWNKKIKELDALIDGDKIKINEGYKDFLTQKNEDMAGIQDAGNITFSNGVSAYKTDIKTKEPGKRVNYNMRIAVPYYFEQGFAGDTYKLSPKELYVLPNVRMSIYNDTIYSEDETTGVITKVCTNADIQLDRSYLAFFHKEIDGNIVGVVIVLRYEEGVYDTFNQKLFLTGRRIGFGGNYSSSLKIDNENRDVMYYETKTSGKQGIKPTSFAFNSQASNGTRESIYNDINNHKELKDNASDLVMFIDFREVSLNKDSASTQGDDSAISSQSEVVSKKPTTYNCFVIIRNNTYVSDGKLLNWLATDEAKGMTYVQSEELRKRIRGEFSLEPINYTDWKAMQDIRAELDHDKDGVIMHLIRTVSIVFGSLLIILSLLFILAYWFDIFNTFTDFSILHFISAKNMYPIADKESMHYVSEYVGKTKFVTFKDLLFISIACCFIGVLFLSVTQVLEFFFSIYTYLMEILGAS